MTTTFATTPIVADPLLDALTVAFTAILRDPAVDPVRLERAAHLIALVERRADGGWLVPSSDGRTAYLVDASARTCSCPDYQKRQTACKHSLAVRIAQHRERAEVEAEQAQMVDVDVPIPYLLTPEALAYLDGESVDLPHQCARCGSENALLTHCDQLGPRCIARELFGDSDDAA